MSFSLKDLEAIIESRTQAGAGQSYTQSLLEKGAIHCARKMGEEAIETIIAATEHETKALVSESADLVYHLMVLWRAKGVLLSDVEAELQRRTSQSGHAEKAARPKG